MEDYQRALIGQMTGRLALYDSGEIPLPKLVDDLRGLFEAAGPRELSIRDSFEELWAELDAESELRTEPWAPPGLADDAHLRELLRRLRSWIDG
ncbi:hypothetical protein [Streptosporangium sp. 'caverna']|uniref:hypothetical protein n=1 Tax=Streptosporangium sp. 'caverna' TaxID=2202249 RepID=UPI000D7E0B7F|nr:hypothetical protein [Streptosporangium sp. 'caverna']AWS47820.1 hypothetical protein DKM19_47605 [Streptosporangium sp. 'caverna']